VSLQPVARPPWHQHGVSEEEVTLHDVPGGVCAVRGITAAAVRAGLKPSGLPDLALVDAGATVAAAVVQTTSQVKAAPVRVTAEHVADGHARAVILNSGNANACTGEDGLAVARETAARTAALLGCDPGDVLVCSTGVIGVPLPRTALLPALDGLVAALGPEGSAQAAEAIMTTDTLPKEVAVRVADAQGACVVGGIAKGSGMIDPAMATMLCVLTTDAAVAGDDLQAALRRASDRTFGRITVDGCMSTNDAVVLLATGGSQRPPAPAAFEHALTEVCGRLAEALVRDGEGATRLVRVTVGGALTEEDAVGVARAVAASALVRTAIAGGDPNWGRILAAMGAGQVGFDPDAVDVSFGAVTVCQGGVVAAFDPALAAAALEGDEVDLRIDLHAGPAQATVLTCDLTHGYVTINADYTT
jgi:glutamate N-acetyltransferase / amino-acid N-acetyltransferase